MGSAQGHVVGELVCSLYQIPQRAAPLTACFSCCGSSLGFFTLLLSGPQFVLMWFLPQLNELDLEKRPEVIIRHN